MTAPAALSRSVLDAQLGGTTPSVRAAKANDLAVSAYISQFANIGSQFANLRSEFASDRKPRRDSECANAKSECKNSWVRDLTPGDGYATVAASRGSR